MSLRKLKGRSPAEFYVRACQSVNATIERVKISRSGRIPGDEQFLRKFHLDRNSDPENLLDHFRSRGPEIRPILLKGAASTAAEFRKRFPEAEAAVISQADKLCEGSFRLLGYQEFKFGGITPNWHFDPISGTSTPKVHWTKSEDGPVLSDLKVTWELNRHQYFSTLGRAYLLTKNEKYSKAVVSHLENWFSENLPKMGVNWFSSLEIAFRAISWIRAFSFFKDSPELTSAVFVQLLKYLYLSGRHIETYLSTYSSPNTHLTGEALGLYFLGSFMPELEEGRRWKKLGYDILMSALDFQVRSDGVYCEQSSHYQRYTVDFYTTLLILRELEGEEVERKHRESLSKLLDFLLHITQPNGETPLFGDEDGGRLHFLDDRPISDFRSTLAVGAALLERGDLKFVAGEASPELLWLVGENGLRKFDELEALPPAATSRAFREGGYYVMRDSWDEDANFLLVDCGPHGFMNGGHAHADALSFVLSVRGEPVFVDSGTYKYASDLDARQLFRSTSAHNCMTVNGESSSIPGGAWDWKSMANCKLLEWQDDGETVRFRGTHDGYERFGVVYEREIVFQRRDTITITDSVTASRSNDYDLHFILDPNCEAEISGQSVSILIKKHGKRQLLTIDTDTRGKSGNLEGRWVLEPWYVSPRYGSRIESSKLIYSLRADQSFQIRNILRPV